MKNIWNQLMKNGKWFYIINTVLLILTCSNLYFLYTLNLLSGIENFLRLWIGIVIIIIWLLCISIAFQVLIKKKKRGLYTVIIVIYAIILSVVATIINNIYSKIDNISSNHNVYSTSIVTLKDNKATDINSIGNGKFGILNDENSIDGYQIAQDIIKEHNLKNEIIKYDVYTSLLTELYEGNIEYVFLPSNYVVMFNQIEGFEKIEQETKVIYTKEKKVKKKNISKKTSIKEPFTLLLMGVDSKKENIKDSSFNGDALMLITFNPNTLNATILSIPRDSYVPIACFPGQRKNKITHAAWYGEECMIDTIENFTGIKIDYYLKINFKGVVKLVDALGGIDVDVPYQLCEQNSSRQWGKNTVYIDKTGVQTLNGEQALALARNRHAPNDGTDVGYQMRKYCPTYNKGIRNDFVRGQNQQLVVQGILNKAKSIRNIDTLYKLLDTISNNMETNMTTNEILSFYNVGKDILNKSKDQNINEIIRIQKLKLKVADAEIYDYNPIYNVGMKAILYHAAIYQGSLNDVVKAMKINLGLIKKEPIKTFSFSINEPYKEKIIGDGYYNEVPYTILPDFFGKDKEVAINFGLKHNIKININYVSRNSNHFIGQIVGQDIHRSTDVIYVKTLNIDVVNEIIETKDPTTEIIDCSLEENKEHSSCLLPNFVGKNISDFEKWEKQNKYSIQIIKTEITKDDDEYDETKKGKIIYQSKKPNTSIYDLIENSLEIRYISLDSNDSEDKLPEEILP